jgi:polysaccharide pyruvyl transferase WcaK-like protein
MLILKFILQNTQRFINENITLSEPFDSTTKLKAHFDCEKYDAIIVGSDQTWRPKYSPNIKNFFLDFLEGTKIIRIAYASSFGVDNWEFSAKQTIRCAHLAKKFDAISVREDSGIDLCRKYLGVDAIHVFDPTLLIEKENYFKLIGKYRLKDNPTGIYTYFLDKTPKSLALTKKVEEELNEQVYSCQAKYGINPNVSNNLEDFFMPDILDWLAGFANAKFVITDSYHGCIFSILFNTPFLAVANQSRGLSRFQSLLNIFNLDNRLLVSENDFKREYLFSDINWDRCRKDLLHFKTISRNFLFSNFF